MNGIIGDLLRPATLFASAINLAIFLSSVKNPNILGFYFPFIKGAVNLRLFGYFYLILGLVRLITYSQIRQPGVYVISLLVSLCEFGYYALETCWYGDQLWADSKYLIIATAWMTVWSALSFSYYIPSRKSLLKAPSVGTNISKPVKAQ